jgi:hypothetical protein
MHIMHKLHRQFMHFMKIHEKFIHFTTACCKISAQYQPLGFYHALNLGCIILTYVGMYLCSIQFYIYIFGVKFLTSFCRGFTKLLSLLMNF